MRILSEQFVDDLKTGTLKPFLELVNKDATISMEIRKDYVNIYYRGGNLLKIEKESTSKGKKISYVCDFDWNYFKRTGLDKPIGLLKRIHDVSDANMWIKVIPILKHAMDLWFGRNARIEREFQQVMVRENNFCNAAESTDYFICDIEYDNEFGKFDLIAVRWPSTPQDKKNNCNLGFAMIEMKYMDSAIDGGNDPDKSDIKKHLKDMGDFLSSPERVDLLKEEMRLLFNQKIELGLIKNKKRIESFNNEKPECILVLANHKPSTSILKRVLDDIQKIIHAENYFKNFTLKFAVSTFMGYGLYQQNIYTLDEFSNKFEKQIYSK